MPNSTSHSHRSRAPLASVSLLALAIALPGLAAPAFAEDSARPVVSNKKPTAANATINLVNLLVKQGVLDEEQAAALIKQAEDEAYVARQSARDATVKADEANKTAAAAAAAASPPGSKHVTYVPEVVKRQLREDIRKEVMTQAKNEGWASPGKYPEWASRIHFSGDIRGRWEAMFFPRGGANSTGEITDFNTLNNGSAYDISNISNPSHYAPLYNTTQDRNRLRLRARLGMEADIGEGFSTGLRFATGSDSSPVSTNQTLGGSGGNFSKYSLWLDRAYVKFEPFKHPNLAGVADTTTLAVSFGRFDTPFWAPTQLVWNSDLGFDGVAVQARHEVSPGFSPFVVAGAFPIFNTALDFATTEPVKFKSQDKYLLGGQIGADWQATPLIAATLGVGVFDFTNVRGRLSRPCDLSVATSCDTDSLRPSFAQKGNTYMALRNLVANNANGYGTTNQYQYFGLTSDYRPIELSGRLDFAHFDPIHVTFDSEFVWNSAFNRARAEQIGINNRGPITASNPAGRFEGGDKGWLTRVTVGNQKLTQFGDWSANVGYKYLESDAIMDAFAESDFGMGGTNLKGYFLGGSVALSHNVTASAKWMSATAIAGAPYSADLFQFDLNAKF